MEGFETRPIQRAPLTQVLEELLVPGGAARELEGAVTSWEED